MGGPGSGRRPGGQKGNKNGRGNGTVVKYVRTTRLKNADAKAFQREQKKAGAKYNRSSKKWA